MNAYYDVIKLNAEGIRDSVITKYESLSAHLVRKGNSQIQLAGTCLGEVPLALGDRAVLARNATQIFSGLVTDLTVKCEDCQNNIKTWEAVIEGDAVVLSWRYAFASSSGAAPSGIVVDEDVYDKLPNNNNEASTRSALNRMLYYIRKIARRIK